MTGPQPLAGLRVLDLGTHIAGPLAAVLLADQGADVIRVVRQGSPSWDPHCEAALDRGKRVVTADVTVPEESARVRALALECDVVIEDHRPGALQAFGLDTASLRAAESRLVVVSMPAYSQHDPRSGQSASDSTISAATGLFTDLSVAGALFGLPPTYTALPLPSAYAGLWGAIGAVAAVHGRMGHGVGSHVEVPLMDAAMSAATGVIFQTDDQPPRYNSLRLSRRAIDAIRLHRVPDVVARSLHHVVERAMPPLFRSYRCSDGALLFLCAIDNANQIRKLLDVTDLNDAASELGLVDGDVLDAHAEPGNLNAYRGTSRRWRRLHGLVADRLAQAPAEEWADRLARAGVPAVRTRSTAEWAEMPVMHESGVLVRDAQGVPRPAPLVDVRGTGADTAHPSARPGARSPGRERRDVDGLAGIRWAQDRSFVGPETERRGAGVGAPLAGVRVVDFSNVIAGPAAGRTLAQLGAEVVHVSPVRPRMGPRFTLLLGLEVNRGKRSIACDLGDPDGQRILAGLVRASDVVVHNNLPAQARRLGLAPDEVHAVNEQTVVTAITAYGGTQPGGWEDRPGYDPIVQALTGIMQRYGGAGTPAVHGIASCIDYFTGYSAAFGTVVALLARAQGSTGLSARASLVRTAAWIQVAQLGRIEEQTDGVLEKGPHPLDRLYRTRDGWVHVDAAAARTAPPGLAAALRWRRTAEAAAWCHDHGLLCQRVRSAAELRRSAVDRGTETGPAISGRVVRERHPSGVTLLVPDAQWLRWDGTAHPPMGPAPAPGEHTQVVLADLGYDSDEIADLVSRDVVSLGWPTGPLYLPR